MLKKILPLFTILVMVSCGASVSDLEKKAAAGDKAAGDQLIKMLSTNKESSVRAQAASALGNAKFKAGNVQLLKSLETDDDTVRKEIVFSLGKIGVQSNYIALIKIWNNKNEKDAVKLNALKGLGYFSNGRAINILAKATKNDDSTISISAIEALGNSNSNLAVKPLLAILKKNTKSVAASKSLFDLNKKGSLFAVKGIIAEKVKNYEFDESLTYLVKLIGKSKYKKAQTSLAAAYLFCPSSNTSMKAAIKVALKDINLDKSYAVVTASALNLRSKPNTRSKVTGSLGAGELALIIEKTALKFKIDDKNTYWYKVKTNKNKIGWLYGGYLTILNHTLLEKK